MPKVIKYLRRAGVLALAAALTLAMWHGLTPTLKGISISPRKVYRLEYYDASPVQRILHHDMHIPSVVRLYRIEPEALLGESDVVDLWINGQLYWYLEPPMNEVRVGRDVVFGNIPPECKDCPPLTDAQMMP